MIIEWFIAMGPAMAILCVLIGLLLLFLAREPFHHAIKSFTRVFYSGFRLASSTLSTAQNNLSDRNKEVLLALGKEHSERIIEREFDRVEGSLKHELSEYPSLHRRLNEHATMIEETFAETTEVPHQPTGWSKAVEAIAKLTTKTDPLLIDVMDDIHKSMKKAEKQSLEVYRNSCKEKHLLLKNMLPHWRSVQQQLSKVDKNIAELLERGRTIDRLMEDYDEIRRGTTKAVRMLSSSSLSQFFISFFVLLIACGGAVINFNLIARPMAEMVGGTSMIGYFQVADIAALVIILVEISMGLFLMECLRITRLFPVIHALNDRIRIRMFWITLTILVILASVEAGLAFMREILMQEDLAISAHLRGGDVMSSDNDVYWITTAAQMGMGFILPFALTFVAIPLENFVSSLRTVLGLFASMILKVIASVFRLLGNISLHLGRVLNTIYDLIIFGPLWIEQKLHKRMHANQDSTEFFSQENALVKKNYDEGKAA